MNEYLKVSSQIIISLSQTEKKTILSNKFLIKWAVNCEIRWKKVQIILALVSHAAIFFLFIADDDNVSALGQIVAQRVPTAAGFSFMWVDEMFSNSLSTCQPICIQLLVNFSFWRIKLIFIYENLSSYFANTFWCRLLQDVSLLTDFILYLFLIRYFKNLFLI